MIFFDSASPMPGSCSRSSLEALLMSSCFFIGLPAPPLASGVSLLAGGLVVVPAASAIGTETAPSANSSATNTAMSLVLGMNALAPIVADDRANPGEPRSALGAGRRRGRVLGAAERRVDRRLAAAAGDAQGDLRAGRRARHAPREVVRALDRLALEGDDDVAGPHPSGMLTLTATPMPQSLPRPMPASLDEAPLADPRFAYEPKYDGIRALAMVRAGGGPGAVRLWSRLGNDKTSQFPEIARALAVFARKLKADVLLDGEIVALDQHGEPAGFQRLQGRIHLTSERDIGGREGTEPVAFVAFDVLRDGHTDLTALPLTARRARLERIFGNTGTTRLRLSDFRPGDGRTLYRDVLARGGVAARGARSRSCAGRSAWSAAGRRAAAAARTSARCCSASGKAARSCTSATPARASTSVSWRAWPRSCVRWRRRRARSPRARSPTSARTGRGRRSWWKSGSRSGRPTGCCDIRSISGSATISIQQTCDGKRQPRARGSGARSSRGRTRAAR